MAVLASPKWHPHGPPPPAHRWHHGSLILEPTATTSIAAGILPTGVSRAGSTGTPNKLEEKKKNGVPGVAGAGSTGTIAIPVVRASASVVSYE